MFEKFTKTITDFFGGNNEFVDSTEIMLNDRLTSPFYGYFVTSFVVVNWKLFYSALFVSQEYIFNSTGLLRYEYITLLYPQTLLLQLWNFLILPLVLTSFFFWVSPFITRPFYRKSLKNQKVLQTIKIQESTEKVEAEKDFIEAEAGKVRAETKLVASEVEKEKEVSKVWNKEFKDFVSSPFYSGMDQMKYVIYENSGSTYKFSHNSWNKMISSNFLAFADSIGLITIEGSDHQEKIRPTKKGRFFIGKYLDQSS